MADDIQLARAAEEAVLATEGVHSMGSGRYAEAATYGAGEKVLGVVVRPEEIEVHIVALYPLPKPIPDISKNVAERVTPLSEGRRIKIVVEDLKMDADENL